MAPRTSLLLVAAAAAACAPRIPPPDLALEPEELLEQVRGAAAAVVSISGEARLRANADGRVSVAAFVAAQKPDRLRIEVLDFFGNPAAVLVSTAGRLAIYDARARAFYRGAATPENVAKLVRLPLAAEELVAVLCGWPLLSGEAVRADPGRGQVTLEVRDGTRTTTARVIAGAAVARASVRRARGSYEIAWRDRIPLGGATGPGDVTLSAEQPRVALELSWAEPDVNAPLDAALFELRPPAGARVIELDVGEPPPPLPLPEGSARGS